MEPMSFMSILPRTLYSYPKVSEIAKCLPPDMPDPDVSRQQYFWTCYVTAALLEKKKKLCRDIGISAAGFYKLQTLSTYRHYQLDFSTRVSSLTSTFKFLLVCLLRQDSKESLRKAVPGFVEERREATPCCVLHRWSLRVPG